MEVPRVLLGTLVPVLGFGTGCLFTTPVSPYFRFDLSFSFVEVSPGLRYPDNVSLHSPRPDSGPFCVLRSLDTASAKGP